MFFHLRPIHHVLIGLIFYLIAGTIGLCRAPPEPQNKKHRRRDPTGRPRIRRRRRASTGPWSGSSRCSKKARAGTPSTASTATTSNAARSTTSSKVIATALDKNPNDGTAWLILGLLEASAGRDAAAVTALTKAEETRKDDPLPSYYLGQALVLIGQPENAALAFERALMRKPTRTDLLDIFQSLGRVYRPPRRTTRPSQVWNRLEAIFPGDPASRSRSPPPSPKKTSPPPPYPRFEALAKKASDPFRQVQLAISAADLKVRLGTIPGRSPRLRGHARQAPTR